MTLALAGALVGGTPASSQSVTLRSPNLQGGWTAPRGVIQLNFLHRFTISERPLRKVSNTPTFNLSTGVVEGVSVGAVYGSNSSLVPAYPNEWEMYARALPLSEGLGAPVDVSVQAGYNTAAESVDGELFVARSLGPIRLMAAGRAFSRAFDSTATRFAVTGGAGLRLSSSVSVAADYGVLLDRAEDEPAAWGVGLQIGVPYTPHSFSIHASNVGTASLEGVSKGTRTRWGFEYTIPITIRRYVRRGGSGGASEAPRPNVADPMAESGAGMASGDTVYVDIKNIAYAETHLEVAAGTTVIWRNLDPIQHSVAFDAQGIDSGLIDPNGSFAMTFGREGIFDYHCIPHPFMEGQVVVRNTMESDAGGAGRTYHE